VTTHLAAVAQLAVPFVWLGMVLAISFLETPLKFRAPGITVRGGKTLGRAVVPRSAHRDCVAVTTLL
jgi:hypothetical protein